MEKRHVEQLISRIEELAATGSTEIQRWEFLRWFSQERMSKTVWRTVAEYIRDIAPAAEAGIVETECAYQIFDFKKSTALSEKT